MNRNIREELDEAHERDSDPFVFEGPISWIAFIVFSIPLIFDMFRLRYVAGASRALI